MPHWRVIEASGSSAERRIYSCGHSPIAGGTLTNEAIRRASTGLAQGARPSPHSAPSQRLLQQLKRTHPTPSRCSLVLQHDEFLLSRSSSRKRRHPPSPPSYLKDHHSTAQSSNVIWHLFHFFMSDLYYYLLCIILSFMSLYGFHQACVPYKLIHNIT